MINKEDQFEESKCEICGKAQTLDHTHKFDGPRERKKYAHITATRPVDPNVPTHDPIAYARERMLEKYDDPEAARETLRQTAETRATSQKVGLNKRTGSAELTSGLLELKGGVFNGAMNTSASAHVLDWGVTLKSHPAYAMFHKVHVVLKNHVQVPAESVIGSGEPNSCIIPKSVGRFHIDAIEPGNQDGVTGIRINGIFYPDEQIHSVDYVKDARAPKKMTAYGAEEMSLDEQREWYEKQQKNEK